MSKFKDHYIPSKDIEKFKNLYLEFQKKHESRYNCDYFEEYISDGSLGWEPHIKITEIHSYDNFYADTRYLYEFYKFITEVEK